MQTQSYDMRASPKTGRALGHFCRCIDLVTAVAGGVRSHLCSSYSWVQLLSAVRCSCLFWRADVFVGHQLRTGLMISAWTDRRRRVAAAFVVAAAASLAGLADTTSVAVWVGVAVAATAVASLFVDEFAGALVGLAAAAAVIAVRRSVGPWGTDTFWLSLVQTIALVATGVAGGRAGRALRDPDAVGDVPTLVPQAAFGSLGLLEADVARGRLDEEVERAFEHRRPLTLVLLDIHVVDDSLGHDGRRAAIRAVARIFESRMHRGDVPFAMTLDRLGAVLPETTSMAAWERIGLVLDAVTEARFTVRTDDSERQLGEAVHIDVGLAEFGVHLDSADSMLDAASARLQRRPASVETEDQHS